MKQKHDFVSDGLAPETAGLTLLGSPLQAGKPGLPNKVLTNDLGDLTLQETTRINPSKMDLLVALGKQAPLPLPSPWQEGAGAREVTEGRGHTGRRWWDRIGAHFSYLSWCCFSH